MPIQFACPYCRIPYTVNDRLAGTEIACAACGQQIVAPSAVPPDESVAPGVPLVIVQPTVIERVVEVPGRPVGRDHVQEFYRSLNTGRRILGCVILLLLVGGFGPPIFLCLLGALIKLLG